MASDQSTPQHDFTRNPEQLLSPLDLFRETGIAVSTQAVWRSGNRYGWREISIKVGRSVRYKRADVEAWLRGRKGLVTSRYTEVSNKGAQHAPR